MPPLTPFSSAANMRSLHTVASTHDQSRPLGLCALSSPLRHSRRFAFALPRVAHASTFLPPVPRRSFALCASRGSSRCGTMKALTPAPLTYGAGLPAYLATPSCRSVSNHVGCLIIAYHHASVTSVFRTSPCMCRLVAAPRRIEFVHPTDRQFASGCSPPRLTATQLPSATEFVASSDTDFHRADVAPSRAHSFRRKPESRRSLNLIPKRTWMPAFTGMTNSY